MKSSLKEERVEEVLNQMGLELIQNTRIDAISGGEKKRLSVASEVSAIILLLKILWLCSFSPFIRKFYLKLKPI